MNWNLVMVVCIPIIDACLSSDSIYWVQTDISVSSFIRVHIFYILETTQWFKKKWGWLYIYNVYIPFSTFTSRLQGTHV
ncbi:hypothetical protein CLU79DRAFT_780985 [Phycomyces nitens]|nr:hypothetical protein CLU79DRAFT_780985 [Phycomyces nitens]